MLSNLVEVISCPRENVKSHFTIIIPYRQVWMCISFPILIRYARGIAIESDGFQSAAIFECFLLDGGHSIWYDHSL